MSAGPQRVPKMVDDRLTVALSHETREHALSVCSVRPTSTKEIAADLDIRVSAAWCHVDRLIELGCLKEAHSRKVRGATEHFYEATTACYFDAAAWEAVPKEKRVAITMRVLRLIAGDVDEAVRAKTVDSTKHHISRTIMNLDPKGDQEISSILAKALEEVLTVRENCAARKHKNKGGGNTTPTSFIFMQLDLPPRDTS